MTYAPVQALDFGLPANQVFQTSGMILRPSFYEPDQDDSLDTAERLRKIGGCAEAHEAGGLKLAQAPSRSVFVLGLCEFVCVCVRARAQWV